LVVVHQDRLSIQMEIPATIRSSVLLLLPEAVVADMKEALQVLVVLVVEVGITLNPEVLVIRHL
jgi:hypothetical protein